MEGLTKLGDSPECECAEPVLLADAVDMVLERIAGRAGDARQIAQDRSGRIEGTEDGESAMESELLHW